MRVVGTQDLRDSLDRCPLPAGTRDDCGSRISAQIVQLAGAAGGHECDDPNTRHWVWHDAGVDDRRLDTAIAAQRAQHTVRDQEAPALRTRKCRSQWEFLSSLAGDVGDRLGLAWGARCVSVPRSARAVGRHVGGEAVEECAPFRGGLDPGAPGSMLSSSTPAAAHASRSATISAGVPKNGSRGPADASWGASLNPKRVQ
jgi:hypothetical protein